MDKWNSFRNDSVAFFLNPEKWQDFFVEHWPEDREKMAQTPQSHVYHAEGDVWTHTEMVNNEILRHPRFLAGTKQEKNVLILSGMLHDVAKTFTTKKIDGEWRAPNHSKKGAIEARRRLWALKTSPAFREQVAMMVYYHQTPFYAFSHDQNTAENLARKLSCDVDISLLCALAEADIRGRHCPDQQKIIDDISLFAEISRELGCFGQEYEWESENHRSICVRKRQDPCWARPQETSGTVYLLSGLPGSGKDTWAEETGLPTVSYDQIREERGLRHGKNLGAVVHAAHDQAREFLRKNQDFVWNATHLSQQMREPALSLIRQYGKSVHIVCVEAEMEDIFHRNNQRDNTLTNQKIMDMTKNWEMPFSWEGDRTTLWKNQKKLQKKGPMM